MKKKPEFHGSDLEKIEEYYHIPKEEIISFGANVNPLGLSASVKQDLANNLDIISSYPDRNYTDLKKAISEYTGVESAHIVVGNGSTELISLLISQRVPKHALQLGPTYSEYARELSLVGCTMQEYSLKAENNFELDFDDFTSAITPETELVIICNPNNPTSSALTQAQMAQILTHCKKQNTFVMVDETYVEFAPDVAAITSVPLVRDFDNFMVIRGVSKFYAAPGLRFGYGITSNDAFLKSLLEHQNPWSLNSIAAFAGERMLRDTQYQSQTRALILSERERMMEALAENPVFQTYPAYGNFILLKILKEGLTSFDVFEAAIRQKMMIRDCSTFEALDGEFIRFCIMSPEDNTRLLQCLNSFNL